MHDDFSACLQTSERASSLTMELNKSRRRRRMSVHILIWVSTGIILTGFSLLLNLNFSDLSESDSVKTDSVKTFKYPPQLLQTNLSNLVLEKTNQKPVMRMEMKGPCAKVEEMGKVFEKVDWSQSLRVRSLIRQHFDLHGAPRVRRLPAEQFCKQGFVIGKASEAGFGNEMYKILTAAGLSIMLNRSLIIGQTRHIGYLSKPFSCLNLTGRYPFGSYLTYSNISFTLKEVKHLWRKNGCMSKFGRHLVMRIDDFENPSETNVLCSNWLKWKQPIIWFKSTTDAVAAQFFSKNIHTQMRKVASRLFGKPEDLQSRPNTFGEIMKFLISPSVAVEEALNWSLRGGLDPHMSLHMRMLSSRSVRAANAVVNCIKKAVLSTGNHVLRPHVVLVSDTPAVIKDLSPKLSDFAEVIHFDYSTFRGNITGRMEHRLKQLEFRAKDWGPAPRWVAFVDFFLASRAKQAVVSGANRRVGTTYAQLVAALAAANQLGESQVLASNFSFFSSFQSTLLSVGLRNQVGWGHVWNRFAGPLSCERQPNQCATTPLLPPAWWDGPWQSPIDRDVRRLETFGVKLTDFGKVNENHLNSFCKSRKVVVKTLPTSHGCNGLSCA
ncbi:hypothetical protein RJ641_014149 [Dillenia turbinata]|uniref:Uncharacterized protein n=1 Tax=Dillenia turbinata TaxID=194707 RepID=A0AAN8UZB6_9MAGN